MNGSKRILIIEDDGLIADLYCGRLRLQGFEVDVALDGKSGLEMFENQRPTVVVLDLMLPDMDGVEIIQALRAKHSPADLPILVFSNAYLGEIIERAWEAGATEVLTKNSHTPTQVVEIVKRALLPHPRPPLWMPIGSA